MNKIRHLAIIMDGNGRWAKAKNKNRSYGHSKGLENLKNIIKKIVNLKIKYLTLYTFSYDNWKRSTVEIKYIFSLLENYLNKNYLELKKKRISVKFIGEQSRLPLNIKKLINLYNNRDENRPKLHINIAFNYSSKKELLNAFKLIKKKKLSINEKTINKTLYTKFFPDPDVLIRTGGHKRLSDFLLWQISYTEIFFVKKLWPDFNSKDLSNILGNFKVIKRNYGK